MQMRVIIICIWLFIFVISFHNIIIQQKRSNKNDTLFKPQD